MSDSRKPQIVLVMAANLVLSLLIGLAILNGNSSQSKLPQATKKAPQLAVSKPVSQADGTNAEPQSKAVAARVASSAAPTNSGTSTIGGATSEPVGRHSPLPAIGSQYPESRHLKSADGDSSENAEEPSKIAIAPTGKIRTMHVPPPPPIIGNAAAPSFGFSGKLAGITVTAVMGNKAMLSLRREGMHRNDKPEVICLAAGEQVRTFNNVAVSVVAVEPYRVTLDVDGDRFVKSLPEIK